MGAYPAYGKNGEYSGHVRVYRMDDFESKWIQIENDIDGEATGDFSGYSLCPCRRMVTNKVAIGSPYNSDNGISSGHVRIYVLK